MNLWVDLILYMKIAKECLENFLLLLKKGEKEKKK